MINYFSIMTNGAILDANGNFVTIGSRVYNDTVNKFNQALNDSALTIPGQRIINGMASIPREKLPPLKIGGETTSAQIGEYIHWDHDRGIVLTDKTGKITGTASPESLLIHEYFHWLDQNAVANRNKPHPDPDEAKHGVKMPEQFAVNNTNEYRKATGAEIRDTYHVDNVDRTRLENRLISDTYKNVNTHASDVSHSISFDFQYDIDGKPISKITTYKNIVWENGQPYLKIAKTQEIFQWNSDDSFELIDNKLLPIDSVSYDKVKKSFTDYYDSRDDWGHDSDGDSIPNGLDPDKDGDGTPNYKDKDSNGNGIEDKDEDIDGDGISNSKDEDIDGDGLPNSDDADADGDGNDDSSNASNIGGTGEGVANHFCDDIGAMIGGGIAGPLGAAVGAALGGMACGHTPPWLPPFPVLRLDPLALDLNGDGVISTLPLAKGVHFDLDNSGFAEKTAWIGAEDGVLTLDRNGNGRVDNGAELFSNTAPLKNGDLAEHGFMALADLDDNHDGRIDGQDAAFADLRVWQDSDSNGLSTPEELFTLAELDISVLYTDYQVNARRDSHGVDHREHGQYALGDGSVQMMNTLWFESDKVNSIAVHVQQGSREPLPDDIAALPAAVGSGNVHTLHDAMRTDATLQALVETFVREQSPEVRQVLSRSILHRWAGAEGIQGKAGHMDAQHLATLEAFWGQKALQEPPVGDYARRSEAVYQDLHKHLHAQLSLQAHYADAYRKIVWTMQGGQWHADYSQLAEDMVQDYADGTRSLATVSDQIDSLNGLLPNNITLSRALHAAIDAQTDNLTSDQREALQEVLYRSDDVIHQHASQISLNAGDGNDTVHGNARDNIIRGGAGNDTLHGNAGNDTLEGGIGNDRLAGGDGQDTYIFAGRFGNDVITAAGDDTVQLQDLNLFEVTFSRNHHDLVLKHEDDTITIRNHFADDTQGIAHILFADGMALDRAGITSAVRIEETVEQLGVNSNNVGFNNIDELLSHYLNNATAHPYDIDALIDGMENGTLDTHQSGEQATLYDIGNLFNHLWGTSQTNPIDRMLDDMENGASHPHTTSTLPYDWTKALEGIW